MNTEFISLDSRINIKKGSITEKKVKTNTEEGLTRFIGFLALVAILVYCIYIIVVDKNYFYIPQLLLVLVWLAPRINRIYISLFVKTWNSAVRIDDILTVTSSKLENGLETQVTLQLKNGRKKFIIFRDAENQIEHFINSVEIKEKVRQVG